MIWLRVGDMGEYESFDGLTDAVDYLNELSVGEVTHWRHGGIETVNYWDHDYISLYHSDADANLLSDLLPDERMFVEDTLTPAYV